MNDTHAKTQTSGPGYSEVLHGSKRWFLYPPSEWRAYMCVSVSRAGVLQHACL